MSHSYAEILLKDPAHLLELLYSKYGNIDEDLEQLYINQILYNKKSHYDTLFKEYQYSDILEEFLRRFYKSTESFPRIPKLSNYYKNYYLFFCKPVFRDCRVNLIMNKYGDTKAEIFYKDNYGNDSELKNENDQRIESSSSSSSSERSDNKNDKCNVNKTIFDKNTRKFIENSRKYNKEKHVKCNSTNSNSNNVKSSDSLILNVCDDSKLNQTLGLISKRSNNSSFLDLMQTLSIKVNIPISVNNSVTNSANRNCINSNNMTRIKENIVNSNNSKKYSKMSSLCTLTKRIAELPNNINNNNNNGGNRFLISPKMKMFLNNNTVKTKFAEFKHNYNNNNNNNNQRKLIPNINASSNISSNNNINKNPSIVVPFHRKNNSYQQNSLSGNTIMSNFIQNHKSSRLTRNNTKRLSYNLSLKKSSIQSNPISNVNSLSNNQNTNQPNNTINHKPKANIIKSPQHSSANAYFNIVFNMTHNTKTKSTFRNKPNNTKTFYIHQSHRSNSQKENTNTSHHNNTNNNNNNNTHLLNTRNSRNQHMFNHNPARTSTQSIKSLSKTKTICTRSVEDKETNSIILNKINTKINILNKHHQYNIYNNMKHTTYTKQLPLFHHKQSHSNQIQSIKSNNKRNTNAKGNIMLKILNGFNIGAANKLKLIQNKSKKSKNI